MIGKSKVCHNEGINTALQEVIKWSLEDIITCEVMQIPISLWRLNLNVNFQVTICKYYHWGNELFHKRIILTGRRNNPLFGPLPA